MSRPGSSVGWAIVVILAAAGFALAAAGVGPSAPAPPVRTAPPTGTATKAANPAALARKMTVDFADTPLPDALKSIAEGPLKTAIVLDPDITPAGADTPVRKITLKAHDIAVASLLKLICGDAMGWKIEGGAIRILPREKLQQTVVRAEYRTTDLVTPGVAAQLIELGEVVRGAVGNSTDADVAPWSGDGGPASLQTVGDAFSVTQTVAGHERIQDLLNQLRGVLAAGRNPTIAGVAAAGAGGARLRRRLDADFEKVSIKNVIKYINDTLPGTNLIFDPEVAWENPALADRPVDLKLQQADAAALLKQVLGPGLAFVESPEYVLVTTPKRAARDFVALVYPISRLLPHRPPGNYNPADKNDVERVRREKALLEQGGSEQVIGTVTTTVAGAPEAGVAGWVGAGGAAYIGHYREMLIVTQTPRGHAKVVAVLTEMLKRGPVTVPPPKK